MSKRKKKSGPISILCPHQNDVDMCAYCAALRDAGTEEALQHDLACMAVKSGKTDEDCDCGAFDDLYDEVVSDDPAVVNQAAKKQLETITHSTWCNVSLKINGTVCNCSQKPLSPAVQQYGQKKWEWAGQGFAKCDHAPQKLINGETWGVYGGTKFACTSHITEYDVIVNLTGAEVTPRHHIPLPFGKKYERPPMVEVLLDWPDMGVPVLPGAFWADLALYLKENGKRALVFCAGGHGRTGTAVACLMVASCAMSAREAIVWIRKNYCVNAVETLEQEKYVAEVAKQLAKPKPETETAVN